MRRTVAVVASVALLLGVAQGAAAQERPAVAGAPRFDVASVKPHGPADDVMFALQFHDGGRFTATGTLRMLIRTAYRMQDFQLKCAADPARGGYRRSAYKPPGKRTLLQGGSASRRARLFQSPVDRRTD